MYERQVDDGPAIYSEWPWVQSGFLTLHALSMLMKIHSYCSLNGELFVGSLLDSSTLFSRY